MILLVAPWSSFWDRNLFVGLMPSLGPVFESAFVRGAVSGVGGITVLAGLVELAGVLAQRHRRQDPPPAES